MSRLWSMLCALAPAACSFSNQVQNEQADAGTDSQIDGQLVDPSCPVWQSQGGPVEACGSPSGDWTIPVGNFVYDTTMGKFVGAGIASPPSYVQDGVRIVPVHAFSLDGTLRVIGSYPLAVVSWSTLSVTGTLDASSSQSDTAVVVGAGARPTNAGAGPGGGDAGGGGGGGYQTAGGVGGNGKNNGNKGGAAGPGDAAAPVTVRGGFAGADGGSDAARKGLGGPGGGAVQLTAMTTITISGTIHAGGATGRGARNGDQGGGGGGSGGYVGLDAPAIELSATAVVAANGGGGATGCDAGNGPEGENGRLDNTRAAGGPASNCTAAAGGGAGGAIGSEAGTSGSPGTESGGGGGGGVGFILAWGAVTNRTLWVSPPLVDVE